MYNCSFGTNVFPMKWKVGFRKHKSTVLTAGGFTDDIAMGLNNAQYVCSIFFFFFIRLFNQT